MFLLFLISTSSYSKTISICDYFPDYCSNLKRNQNRPVNSAAPTQSSAVFSNPAAVSTDKGFGVESISYQTSQFGIITGTGIVGAAISNNPSNETFFGNGAQEDTMAYRERWFEKKQFESQKFVFSTSFNVFGKKKKKGLKMDAGIIYRNIPEIQTSYSGGGVAFSWSRILNFGYSEYRDAYVKDYRNQTVKSYAPDGTFTNITFDGTETNLLEQLYRVKNYVVGLNYGNWSFDYSWLTTTNLTTNDKYYVKIFNTSYFYRNWMLTYGLREEESTRETFDEELNLMIPEKFKYDGFLGIQYALGDHFVVGIFNNYYLLDEWSLGLTYFF